MEWLTDIPRPVLIGAAVLVALWVWRTLHPASWWYAVVFPRRVLRLRWSWRHVASGCGLTKKRHVWWFTVVPNLIASTGVVRVKRKFQRVEVDRKPWMGLPRPTPSGWRVTFRLLDGQIPADYAAVCERLAHAWGVYAVRVVGERPGWVTLAASLHDPLAFLPAPEPGEEGEGDLLKVVVGRLETGEIWAIDFRSIPHWINAGATQSGKSNLVNALICGLAPQMVALIGFDLKGGVELSPYRPRLPALATARGECVALLSDLLRVMACREHGARNVWQLPAHLRPIPAVVIVDELAELFLMADKSEKEEVAQTSTALLRLAQLGRAFGIYLFLSGQRIGSDLGAGVTALRAQMSGRICHRVNDPETATMTLGDLDPGALTAARSIAADSPGVAIVTGADGRWYRARSHYVTERSAEYAAETYAHITPSWQQLLASGLGHDLADLPSANRAELTTS
ncbi:FtsK/SpoIIIE domain-containing protein [Sinosporangium siamense]|uniref:Conjugal transfer protein TraS n=1 Tax=Sinosporangium siamense TaxID=1367973 RepID=A0A919RJE7_9ACTN|nr:FtsK/SpoIIIE domain-containing protein [Sinosporangium siamense]GII94927.1 conjugal transfer protein TraS [Sinosporangium siamense]